MPIRVVMDTNVFISSFWGGNPKKVVDLWKAGEIKLCLSEEILQEYLEVVARFNLHEEEAREFLALLSDGEHVEHVAPSRKLRIIEEDPSDDMFLECAVEAGTRYIVSGDGHLLGLEEFQSVKVLSPKEFLSEFRKERVKFKKMKKEGQAAFGLALP
jgi:putative PIN family toxin of toxin-antitoxin system